MESGFADGQAAADVLRGWALDEQLKERVMSSPALSDAAWRVARRYIAGETTRDALDYAQANAVRGHSFSIECIGESIRSEAVANREADVFVTLIGVLGTEGLSPRICFDLSHIGSLVDPGLALANARRIAGAARSIGTHVMISAEGSDRTDLVLGLYEALSSEFPESGITIQARLHRSPGDLERMLNLPGPVRLVKGAFLEPETVAFPRDSAPMTAAYLSLAERLIDAGHRVNIATHDAQLVDELKTRHGERLRDPHVEFEMLQGLGTGLLDSLHADGYRTREYIVFGPEWWLYVLNRIAEDPERIIAAIADLNGYASR